MFPLRRKLLSEVIPIHIYMHAQTEHEPGALAGGCRPVKPHPVLPRVSRCKTDKPTVADFNGGYFFQSVAKFPCATCCSPALIRLLLFI